jgi:hypothetical protein
VTIVQRSLSGFGEHPWQSAMPGYSAILPEKPKKRRQTDEFMLKQAKLFPYHGVRFNG